MKNPQRITLPCVLLFLLSGCCAPPPFPQRPDHDTFAQRVPIPELKDSLRVGVLCAGMPYYVVREIFASHTDDCHTDTARQVPGPGSRQALRESEGWKRDYADPNIQVFLDTYEVPEGRLAIWYRKPDFYVMDVARNDRICIHAGDSAYCADIAFLASRRALLLRQVIDLPGNHTGSLSAVIFHDDHAWRAQSWWTGITLQGGGERVTLTSIPHTLYPVELIELNGKRISSYRWSRQP
ncbi:MAG: hypothetical protein RRA94_03465 [Bacteroidota bacterium]|nr:hypothetical protein [Bacteroidota bacterium]